MIDKLLPQLSTLGIEAEINAFCRNNRVWYTIRYRDKSQGPIEPWSAIFATTYAGMIDRLVELVDFSDDSKYKP